MLVALVCASSLFAETFTINGSSYDVTRTTQQLASGVTYTTLKFNTLRNANYTGGSMIHVIETDLTDPTVSVKHGDNGRDSRKALATHATNLSVNGATVVAGANANFWCTSETPYATKLKYEPFGASIKDGHIYSDPNCGTIAHVGGPTTTGMLVIDETGKCFIDYLKPQVNGGANDVGSGWNFTLTNHNPAHPHTFGLDQVNGVSCPGTASMYSSIYGANKAFRPVVSMGDYTTQAGTCTEVLMDFASGTTDWNIGGETKLVIKEIRYNAGSGTLGNYDCAIVCRDSYASVAGSWAVGDEMSITAIVNFQSKGSPARILQATSGNCICMANGVVGYNATQESYNSNSYARTLYGTNDAGTKLWIAVCEHYPNKQYTYLGFSTTQMAYVLKNFGATWATQVDCGGSSQMYAGGKQVSTSTDSGGLRNVQSGVFILSTADAGSGGGTTDPDPEPEPEPEPTGEMSLHLNYEDLAIAELAGKTVKRVVPSNDGSHLYILAHAGTTATVLVYDHINKSVKEQLGTTHLVSGREYVSGTSTGDLVPLSDIDITDDGILVGMGKSCIPLNKEGVYLYRWANGSDGIATGELAHWNVTNLQGNYSNGIVGEAMAYYGNSNGGYVYYSAQTAAGTGLRWVRLEISSTGMLQGTNYYNLGVSSLARTNELFLDASPLLGKNQFIVNKSDMAANALTFAESNRGQASTTAMGNVLPTSARHTPIFKHGGHYYMVGATATGVQLADVTRGVTGASAVTIKASALASNSTTNVAAVGTAFNGTDLALFVIRDGKISRYSTVANPKPIPTAPVLTGEEAYLKDNEAYARFTWTAPEHVEFFDTEQLVNGEWVAFQYGFGATFTTLDWKMPDQAAKSWTLRVRAGNTSGTSDWSDAVTLTYTAPSTITASQMDIHLTGAQGTSPYVDVEIVGANLQSGMNINPSTGAVIATTQDGWNALTGGVLRIAINPEKAVGTYAGYVAVQSGEARITINVSVEVTAPIVTGDMATQGSTMRLHIDNAQLVVEGIAATHIALYAINGGKICEVTNSNTLVLGSLKGVYVAKITDANGGTYTTKVLVK